ncbi:toprim domain-containing protein [Flavitalea flava]
MPSCLATAAKLFIEADVLEKEAVLGKVFSYCKRSLPLTREAVAYLQSRGIDYRQSETGYNGGVLHRDSKQHHLLNSLVKYGLIKPRPAGGYSVWAKDCVIFPLRNPEHKVVSLYGRSITNNSDQRHFYLGGREGLYPGYPKAATTRLILVESIIDAVTILQQPAITIEYEVLALYGTNGLTDEHSRAILSLKHLEEIIFLLNGDEPGEAATATHYQTLHGLLPHIKFTKVALPENEDVNSLLQTHDDPRILADLLAERKAFSLPVENKKPFAAETLAQPIRQVAEDKLITTNPELLVYESGELLITVLGGIKITGLDRMRVTLKIEHKTKQVLPVRHNLDLYNQPHSEQLIHKIAESFDSSTQTTTQTLAGLTSALESYRARRVESLQPRTEEKPTLSPAQRQAAINYLKQANLLERTSEDIGRSGIVGEETNRLIAYLVYSSRKLAVPLHLMFLGSSGSGKTYLQEKVSELIPPEDKIEITQITENAFYYFRQDELKNKLLLIEDLDGAESSMYPLRELQSKRRISKTVTLKDSKGNLKTITLLVEGPVSVSGCTTREKLYEDNANRCLLLYIDTGKDQDRRVIEYQTRLAGGEINREAEHHTRQQFQHIQRVLTAVQVINPYAKYIHLPEQVFKPRRTMTLLLSFIETITFYHQYQRPVKRDGQGNPYVETTIEDIQAAFALLKDALFSKSDELTQATRSFLEGLKVILHQQQKETFTAKEIRAQLKLNPSNLKRYLVELDRYGYIKGKGNRYRKYEYHITNYQEYEQLKSSIDQHLAEILTTIRNKSQ